MLLISRSVIYMHDESEPAMATKGHSVLSKGERGKVLARRGFRVFPLHSPVFHENGSVSCSCKNPQCTCIGKHPRIRDFQHGATTDGRQIETWWAGWPEANIGILAGKEGGMVVIDVDGPEGENTLRQLERLLGNLPSTLEASTGKGRHLYFVVDGETEIRNSAGALGVGLDVRGEGGYVVGPGSVHENGRIYEWIEEDESLAELPRKWVDFILGRQHNAKGTEGKGEQNEMAAENGSIGEGRRNSDLHSFASSLVHKGMPKKAVLQSVMALNESSCSPPLGEKEVRNIVESAWSYRGQETAESSAQRQLRLRLTDEGNAERLNAGKGNVLLWDKVQKRYMVYDGKVWNPDDGELVQTLAREVVKELEDEAKLLEDPRDRAAMIEFAAKCQTPTRIKAVLEIYKMDETKFVKPDDFDSQPNLLNCQNGVVNLKTRELLSHDPKCLLSHCVPVEYDPKARSPLWEAFLDTVFQGDIEALKTFRSQVGYQLTGEMKEQKFFVWLGNGRNGKSTIRNVLTAILGDHVGNVSSSAFTVKRFSSESYELGQQAKKRLIFSAEITGSFQLDEPLIKSITGGDSCTFREIYQKPVNVYPTFKIVFPCNRIPEIRGTDDGIWDRSHFLLFKHRFEGNERVQDYHNILLAEKEGILTWLVEAAAEWYGNGLFVSGESDGMCRMFRSDADPLARFLGEECEISCLETTTAKDLYGRYLDWCGRSREIPQSANKFGMEMAMRQIRGVSKEKSRNGIVYRGIGLRPDSLLSGISGADSLNSDLSDLPSPSDSFI